MLHPQPAPNRRRSLAVGIASLCAALAWAEAALGQGTVPFDIDNGQTIPDVACAMRVTVLGCANRSSSYGGYNRATTLKVHVTNSSSTTTVYEPFGPFDQPVNANVNDDSAHFYVLSDMFDPGSQITITGRSWSWDGAGNSSSNWTVRQTENSNLDPDWVVVLKNGDEVPDLDGFADQASVEDYLEPFIDIDEGEVVLGPNDAIYLFELAASDTDSVYYDLQDLVVLVTLGDSPLAVSLCYD